MPDDKDKKQPASAPEVDPQVLTQLQKQRIEAEFDLEEEADAPSAPTAPALSETRQPAAKKPAAAVAPTAADEPAQESDEQEMPGVELVDDVSPQVAAPVQPLASDMAAASEGLRDDDDDGQAGASNPTPVQKPKKSHGHPVRHFFAHKKKLWIPLLLLAIIGALGGVPYTRYKLAGYVITQPYQVTVTDASTKKPVSSASVNIDGQKALTDKDGKATVEQVTPGPHKLTIAKKYYKDASSDINVPLYGDKGSATLAVTATGRQVPLSVVNKLTGKPLENATVKAAGTEVKTDKDGKALIVLPADKPTLEVSLAADGYDTLVGRLTVTDQMTKDNDFRLTPTGRLYFLSKQSGKIDVVATDLDGGDRETVVFGTGKEDDRSTVLLASRDWKYLALYSKRDSGAAKLYLLDTSNNKLTTIDDGASSFSLIGWSGHSFAYMAARSDDKAWLPGYQAIKSYDAEKKQLLTLDQNQGEGDQSNNKFQQFSTPYLVGDKLAYAVEWFSYAGPNNIADRNDSVRMVTVGSQSKKDLRTFPAPQLNSFSARVYEPGGVYFAAYSLVDSKYVFFEFEDGQVKDADVDQNKFFNGNYPTYLQSPDGSKVFWNEQRDGRESFFVGDQKAENAKQVATIEDGTVYGWYGNDYLLASKNGSELYVLPVGGGAPLKVSDYHKPSTTYPGYGGGYGGL